MGAILGGTRIKQKDKRTHQHGQQCGDCGVRWLNDNGKKVQ